MQRRTAIKAQIFDTRELRCWSPRIKQNQVKREIEKDFNFMKNWNSSTEEQKFEGAHRERQRESRHVSALSIAWETAICGTETSRERGVKGAELWLVDSKVCGRCNISPKLKKGRREIEFDWALPCLLYWLWIWRWRCGLWWANW